MTLRAADVAELLLTTAEEGGSAAAVVIVGGSVDEAVARSWPSCSTVWL